MLDMKVAWRRTLLGVQDAVWFLPSLVHALFVPPASDEIETRDDLIYEYGQAIKNMPQLLRRLAFRTRTLEDELQEVRACLAPVPPPPLLVP